MNSTERHERRYIRRKAKREEKKRERTKDITFEKVFDYGNLYKAYRKCRRGVSWKASVQNYICQAPLNVYETWERLMHGRFKVGGYYTFDVYERGKKRHIQAVGIKERVVQRCLCDNALVPAIEHGFIYDNGASIRFKGYDFSVRRLVRHLQWHYRKYGNKGYILLFDFKRFFENVSHEVVENILRRQISDARIRALVMEIVKQYGDKGLGLGSQISQTLALASADKLDHAVKTRMRAKCYGRYMDDGYIIHPSKEFLKRCLDSIRAVCAECGITLSENKTSIVKLSHGFTYLKIRILLTDKGRIVRRINKKSVIKMRRKLKKFRMMIDRGERTFRDIWPVWVCWKSYAEKFDAYHTVRSMWELFNSLFGEELHVLQSC